MLYYCTINGKILLINRKCHKLTANPILKGVFLLNNFYARNKPYIILLVLSLFFALTLAVAPFFKNSFAILINATSYILWHNIFEFSSIIISICVFCVSYYSFEQKQNLRYLFLGSILFLMALIDFYHVLSYKGMPDFLIANDTANRATTFWIIARLIGGIAMLVPIAIPKKIKFIINKRLFFIVPFLISLIILNIVTYYPWLIPPMYIEGQGLTNTKIILEVIVICLYLLGMFSLLHLYKKENDSFLITLSCALLIGVFSELAFTLYVDVYGIYDFIGHFLKFITYFIIFRVIFIRNVQQPYMDLSIAHAKIKNYADNLDKIVEQRTKEINLIHQNLLDDLEYARNIQLSMLPKEMPDTPGVAFEARYFPTERVGGDFYNIFKLNETKIGMYISDVSGHGVPAAMMTVFLNQSIKPVKENDLGVKEILSPSVVLENLYADFNQNDFGKEVYLAMLYGVYDLSAREFTFSSAGLNVPPIVLSAAGGIKELVFKGLPICKIPVVSSVGYIDYTVKLKKGDKLLFYSDGLTEAENPEKVVYNASRLKALLYKNRNSNALQLADKITEHVFDFIQSDKLRDDITFFIMEIK